MTACPGQSGRQEEHIPTFDVVSRIDIPELDNAINGVRREIQQRFDLKGTMCSLERNDNTLTLTADHQMMLRQMHELIYTYCARRGVDIRSLEFKNPESATKGSLRQQILVRQGIEQETGRSIIQAIKGTNLKVQVAIQVNELRVSGKKRDDLQEAMAVIKEMPLELPLQYVNFRD